MRISSAHNSNGFTLVETMAALFSITLSVALVMVLYTSSYVRYSVEEDRSDSRSHCQSAMDYVLRDIRASSAVLSSYGAYTGSSSCLVLQAPAYDASGIISCSYDYIAYWMDDQGKLRRAVSPAAGSLRQTETGRDLVSSLSALAFHYFCRNTFTGDGTTTSFVVARNWTASPTVIVNGAVVSTTYDPGTRTVYLSSAPTSGAVIEAVYPISATDSAAKPDVYAVTVNISSTRNTGRAAQTVSLEAMARMRNKR